MVRSRSLPIAFTGEKEKPKQNDKKKTNKKKLSIRSPVR
jgi:acid phosphatase class B